jgi:hypothetical protein
MDVSRVTDPTVQPKPPRRPATSPPAGTGPPPSGSPTAHRTTACDVDPHTTTLLHYAACPADRRRAHRRQDDRLHRDPHRRARRRRTRRRTGRGRGDRHAPACPTPVPAAPTCSPARPQARGGLSRRPMPRRPRRLFSPEGRRRRLGQGADLSRGGSVTHVPAAPRPRRC